MKSLNVAKISPSNLALLILLAVAPIVVYSCLMPTAAAGPFTSGNSSSSANMTTTTTAANTNATTISRVDLADKPFAIGHYRANPINMSQTQVQFTIEGNTTITSENSTEMITTRDTGQGNVTFLPGGANVIRGQIRMSSEDGTENATGYFAEFMKGEASTGIGVASFSTNSTEELEPLNNKMAVFLDDTQPNGDSIVRFFEWRSSSGDSGTPMDISNNITN
jgi:Cu/Ag efflux protein CusF